MTAANSRGNPVAARVDGLIGPYPEARDVYRVLVIDHPKDAALLSAVTRGPGRVSWL